ncbi:uncharacterized protein LOC113305180 [Papaver somniferum]|uniref:uncharacterized protein LOC113305180 n=1 Tax=Papaver somniferum TaxID=3469 RepID=UPI000E6FE4F6|nr:uncharacterized protein LOC113305180 [Papaver somniferum]
MVQSFFHSYFILKQLNHNFTTLIPKSNCPKNAADFRPISLCNVSYKIISKLLASRLKIVLHKIISPAQIAFISGRLIHDNIIIAYELIHSMKQTKAKDGYAAIKLDMSKAFDRIECGAPGKIYYPQRGLRQGDPLSSYLFILCMEALSRGLIQAEKDNLIHGFKANKHYPSISHLFYADDCLMFIKARTRDARNLVTLIEQFSKFSDQAVNFEKSALAFSKRVPNNIKNEIANILRIRRVSLNEKCLGVSLLLQKRKFDSFTHLLDNTKGRRAHRKPTYLDPPGTVMNQFLLGSLTSHHLVVFPMPKELTDKLDTLQTKFWWGKKEGEKGCYIKGWKDTNLPKEFRGLNIRKTDILNLALLTKLAWRMVENPYDKLTGILRGKYFANSNPLYNSVSKYGGLLDLEWHLHSYRQIQRYWSPLANYLTKINSDASYVDRNSQSGWALIAIKFSVDCDGLRGGTDPVIDPEQAEAQALLKAVLWAQQKVLIKLHLEGDCLNVINDVNVEAEQAFP